MTEFLVHNWGSLTSLAGLVASVVGLAWAIRVARQARTAARAAEAASIKARAALGRTLGLVELQRSIVLIQRLKEVHRAGRWEVALEHYQTLRMMLTEIEANPSIRSENLAKDIGKSTTRLTHIENEVSWAMENNCRLDETDRFANNQFLNDLQVDLERLESSTMFRSDVREGQ